MDRIQLGYFDVVVQSSDEIQLGYFDVLMWDEHPSGHPLFQMFCECDCSIADASSRASNCRCS